MKLGILAYSSATGLGYQTKDYYDHLNPDRVLHIDLSIYNGMPLHKEWYDPHKIISVKGYPKEPEITAFLSGLDVVLMAETPLNYELYKIARQRGVKTVTAYNFEFFDHFIHPEYELPDVLIAPSKWRFNEIDLLAKSKKKQHIYLHHPVDRNKFKYRQRRTHKTIHIAGNPAYADRNGTWEYLEAEPTGTVITQSHDLAHRIRLKYRNSRVITNVEDPASIYTYGDILVLPRKYGGNCLPLNEALSSGMPVIMPDIEPNNFLLPKDWLVPARLDGFFEPRTKVNIYKTDVDALREKINWFKTQNIASLSEQANEIAETISWETLLPKWKEILL